MIDGLYRAITDARQKSSASRQSLIMYFLRHLDEADAENLWMPRWRSRIASLAWGSIHRRPVTHRASWRTYFNRAGAKPGFFLSALLCRREGPPSLYVWEARWTRFGVACGSIPRHLGSMEDLVLVGLVGARANSTDGVPALKSPVAGCQRSCKASTETDAGQGTGGHRQFGPSGLFR